MFATSSLVNFPIVTFGLVANTDNTIEYRRNIQHILHFSGDIINMPVAPINTPPRIARFRRFGRNRNILS